MRSSFLYYFCGSLILVVVPAPCFLNNKITFNSLLRQVKFAIRLSSSLNASCVRLSAVGCRLCCLKGTHFLSILLHQQGARILPVLFIIIRLSIFTGLLFNPHQGVGDFYPRFKFQLFSIIDLSERDTVKGSDSFSASLNAIRGNRFLLRLITDRQRGVAQCPFIT